MCLSAGPSSFQEPNTHLGSSGEQVHHCNPGRLAWLASSQDVGWKCPDSRGRKYMPSLQALFLAVLSVPLQLLLGIFWSAQVLVNTLYVAGLQGRSRRCVVVMSSAGKPQRFEPLKKARVWSHLQPRGGRRRRIGVLCGPRALSFLLRMSIELPLGLWRWWVWNWD